MRKSTLLLAGILLSVASLAQSSQPTLWASKPDTAAFDRAENAYLAAAQKDLDQLTAVKGSHTIANTLAPYDDAVRNLGSAGYFAGLMQQVHPDAAFRDKAEEMEGERRLHCAVAQPGRV